jgi:hypothetical protein
MTIEEQAEVIVRKVRQQDFIYGDRAKIVALIEEYGGIEVAAEALRILGKIPLPGPTTGYVSKR